ncbi:hypothetical protein PV326_006814 [Microctonus aethiopoides]|nr:hypothetical protein PV326_006814 [Microctonus aethiopoides]
MMDERFKTCPEGFEAECIYIRKALLLMREEAKNEDEEEEEEEEEEEGDEEKGGGKTLAAHQESDKIGDTSCGRPVAMFKPGLYILCGPQRGVQTHCAQRLCIACV